jgi:fatty-acyl-CoA synthase
VPTWNFAAVWEGVAEVVPDRDAIVCGDQRVSWAKFRDRAHRLAGHLASTAGAAPGDKVAIDLTNRPEYLETFYAALLLGCVPVNVNFRYVADEIHYVLDNSDAKVVVAGSDQEREVRRALDRNESPSRPMLLVAGDDYEQALATATPTDPAMHRPSADDLVFLYTGGTTGMPKGVMWRNEDLYLALWATARPHRPVPPDPVVGAREGKRAGTVLPAAPLMHGTGLFATLAALAGAGTVVLVDRPSLDVEAIWDAVERERVQTLTLVGDVFARPLLTALDEDPDRWDLSSLRAITSSGVVFSPDTKRGLLQHLDGLQIVDTLGASEGLGPKTTATASDETIAPARFRVSDRVRVINEATGLDVAPGSGEVGIVAMGGHIPLGYYKDPEKTAATFKVINGTRYSVPGDYATVDDDGSVQLLGRGSASINTGGEKVFVDEVELVLRKHASVADCVVVGVPDVRFGERVVALVELANGRELDEAELSAWCRQKLAGYKTPRRFLFVDSIDRSAAGKAAHPRMRELAVKRLSEADA